MSIALVGKPDIAHDNELCWCGHPLIHHNTRLDTLKPCFAYVSEGYGGVDICTCTTFRPRAPK